MATKKYFFYFLIVIVFIISLFFIPQKKDVSDIKYVKIAGQNIRVDLALTPIEQEKGLSGRGSLGAGEGVLFVFDHPDKYLFWMKDMNFSIDIIWIGEDQKIVYIKKDARPESYPEIYKPNDNAKYILEVTSGFAEKNNLQVGNEVNFVH